MSLTLDQERIGAQTNGRGLHYSTDYNQVGVAFTCGMTGDMGAVHLWLAELGSLAAGKVIWVGIYTNSTNKPSSTQVGGNSDNVSVDALVTSWPTTTEITFSWSANMPSLTATTTYWICVDTDIATSTTNYIGVDETGAGVSSDCTLKVATWTPVAEPVYGRMRTYKYTADAPATIPTLTLLGSG